VNAQNANGEAPLHQACLGRNMSIIRILLENGANINVKTDHGDAPIHWSIRTGDADLVAFLVKRGADVVTPGRYGTAMDVAKNIGAPPAVINALQGKSFADIPKPKQMPPPLPARTGTSSYFGTAMFNSPYNSSSKYSTAKEPNYEEMAKALDITDDDPANFKNDLFEGNLPTVIPSFNNSDIEIPEFEDDLPSPPAEEEESYL